MTLDQRFYVIALLMGCVLLVLGIAAFLLSGIKKLDVDLETRKLRFAAATFTGILLLFVFSAALYFADPEGKPGKEIFEKAVTAMTPLAGVIVGYLFGTGSMRSTHPESKQEGEKRVT